MKTITIQARPLLPEIVYDWANHVKVSKHADARASRAKYRYAKRRRHR